MAKAIDVEKQITRSTRHDWKSRPAKARTLKPKTPKGRARAEPAQKTKAGKPDVSLTAITRRLLSIATKGEDNGDSPGLSLARAALMDAARLNGLVDRKAPAETRLEDFLDQIDGVARTTGEG